ncbi:MAG: 16S rRNA (uracil(1498)-N(3))-methyltransferase [Tyzzerella sp.]|uniref:Ribosomal RNA small subunit methyltransferase E n=1 Tax=Candidatus Fimicola merdigallinarum TaxID=2840819 RepID=A0A9D9DX58_9FIRM|nr:16S rRNA (uracil(1498)-N(3))-methyltransferase [Candidatus Fimicola merdigallinarum]
MPRFFVSPENINGETITISGDDAKHIKSVLRMREGEGITVCDCLGTDYECKVNSFVDREVIVDIVSKSLSDTEPNTKVTLFQGLPKSDKMELIIQKCVELGIDEIVPVYTERCIVKLDKKDKEAKKIERWQKISESAAKQSGRGKIPKIQPVVTFKEAVSMAKNFDGAIIPYENEKDRGLREFVKDFEGKSVAIFIGPEGGFSTEEIELSTNSGIKPITLGKRILRTETAGLCTLSILIYELG